MSEKKEQDIELLILDLVEKFSKRDRFDSFIAAVLKEIHAHDFSESRKLIYLISIIESLELVLYNISGICGDVNKKTYVYLLEKLLSEKSAFLIKFINSVWDEKNTD